MTILRHLWTIADDAPEVRNSYHYSFQLRERFEETLRIAGKDMDKAQVRLTLYLPNLIRAII